jgi:rare lipoprotein A
MSLTMKWLRTFIWYWPPLLLSVSACQTLPPPQPEVKISAPQYDTTDDQAQYDTTYDQTGIASWYGPKFHGKKTASGETFDQNKLTAAHRTLPMQSLVRVTNLDNGHSAIIRINDRGPFQKGRIIDLSKRSASELGIRGTARVRVQLMKEEPHHD